jgi:hypothetical protein
MRRTSTGRKRWHGSHGNARRPRFVQVASKLRIGFLTVVAVFGLTTVAYSRNWYTPNIEVEACQNTLTIPYSALHTPLALKLFEVRRGNFIYAKVYKNGGRVRAAEVRYYDHGVEVSTYFFTEKDDCNNFMKYETKDLGTSEDLK